MIGIVCAFFHTEGKGFYSTVFLFKAGDAFKISEIRQG